MKAKEAAKQLDEFENQVKNLTLDRMNEAPKKETEDQTKLSQKQKEKLPDHYLKPDRIIGSREKFNEEYREDYNYGKEYVQFIAENKEIQGEAIEIWTKRYPGTPAEFWKVPVNKPVWGPRYLAEQIQKCTYHRMRMDDTIITGNNQMGTMYGQMVVDNIVERLSVRPVSTGKSIFMGAAA